MTPERQGKIEATFARLAAEGDPLAAITNARVYREVRGKKSDVSTVGAAWRAQQRAAKAANGAVAVLDVPPGDQEAPGVAYAEEQACRLTDGLPAPTRPRSQPPRVFAAQEAYRAAVVAREAAQRQEQEAARVLQETKVAARQATAWLHERSRVARMAPAHELATALAAVDQARAALAQYVGAAEATRAEHDLNAMPAGLS